MLEYPARPEHPELMYPIVGIQVAALGLVFELIWLLGVVFELPELVYLVVPGFEPLALVYPILVFLLCVSVFWSIQEPFVLVYLATFIFELPVSVFTVGVFKVVVIGLIRGWVGVVICGLDVIGLIPVVIGYVSGWIRLWRLWIGLRFLVVIPAVETLILVV